MELLRGERDVVRVGHRGAAALAPENSLEAIEAAVAHGVDVVELDVAARRDGDLVLAHGPEVPAGAPHARRRPRARGERSASRVQVDVKLPGVEPGVVAALGAPRAARPELRQLVLARRSCAAFAALEPALPAVADVPGGPARRLRAPARSRRSCARRSPCSARSLPARLPRWLRARPARAP